MLIFRHQMQNIDSQISPVLQVEDPRVDDAQTRAGRLHIGQYINNSPYYIPNFLLDKEPLRLPLKIEQGLQIDRMHGRFDPEHSPITAVLLDGLDVDAVDEVVGLAEEEAEDADQVRDVLVAVVGCPEGE